MRTHPKLTGVAVAAALLAGTGTGAAFGAPAAPPAAASSITAAVPFTTAEARRGADGGYTLGYASPAQSVTVVAVTDPNAVTGTTVGTTAGTATLDVPAGRLPSAARWYFRLVPDQGAALVVADRSLGLASAKNFRDAGGYRTTDGHWVRMGKVYRSNKLSTLTAAEQATLLSQGISLDVDLRNIKERYDDPDALPSGIRYQVADVVSVSHGLKFHESATVTLVKALAAGLLSGSSDLGQSIGYPFMVDFVGADYAFHDLLTAVAANDGATVFHCSAGKDRTGWSNAVLLTLLGVPRSTVEADFLASNAYLGREDAVELSWLRAAFSEVDHLYGSFDAYVRDGLKVDAATVAALKSKLLV
ncbi:tyrosine-protein phosphatase [Streptomyces longispororuber]|uniref:tyrosine-protein phosphatase n=1 Tax=Streptomyces longispororuber TaxID=68230 RepID=UPI00210B7D48|nr:tyrosine-protein phosphatase [Streptomyces longispororuber]MCQ4211712.1 tyrosine-protein phosphatase [Streptomyces longispororuber]